jgi:[acyl-carrier-protein] S-malonyltransferase
MMDAGEREAERQAGMAVAFTFPGQGSQHLGMGKALAESFPCARDVFLEVDAALGQKLSRLMWEGPEADLVLTENAQPALMAVSMAVVRVLETEYRVMVSAAAAYVAGHSLGEYSALTAAGTFSLADTARLLKLRGRAMQQATPLGTGAMAALLGLDLPQAAEVAAEAAQDQVCAPANDNAPGQVVVSGHRTAVERAVEIAKSKGARRAVLLPVSAPFHCALMQPAAEAMSSALAEVTVKAPAQPLIANVTATPLSDPDEIRSNLIAQVTAMVRWRECVAAMAAGGVDVFCELGAGKVLSGLLRRNAPNALALAFATPEDIRAGAVILKEKANAV